MPLHSLQRESYRGVLLSQDTTPAEIVLDRFFRIVARVGMRSAVEAFDLSESLESKIMNGSNVTPVSAAAEQLIPCNFIEDVRRKLRKNTGQDFLYPVELIELALNGTLESLAYESMTEKDARDLVAMVERNVSEAAAAVVGLWRFGRQGFHDGHTLHELFGRTIDREQHLADLEQLEQLTLPMIRGIIKESQHFEVVFRKLSN
jgi:hypothetical protein